MGWNLAILMEGRWQEVVETMCICFLKEGNDNSGEGEEGEGNQKMGE